MNKLLFCLIVCCSFTACATFQQKTFKIHSGATESEVEDILGEPVQKQKNDDKLIYTYYPDHSGFEYPYYVVFNSSGVVSQWGPDQEKEKQARQAAYDQSLRLQNLSNGLQDFSNQLQQQRNPAGGSCGALSIAPIARAGCTNSCINGQWAEVCNGF